MRPIQALAAAVLAAAASLAPAAAQSPGDFDYYVLSLSWSPNWCALEGDARDAAQCTRPLGWSLHGLWPQNERGYPADCATAARNPSRSDTAAMADIMGSGGLAFYQWKKHGRCAGLSAQAYFALARQAYDAVARPDLLRQLDREVRLPASVIEEAFLEANPGLEPDMLTITCKAGRIQEARVCLTTKLEPRVCGANVRRDCTATDALFAPVR